MIKGEGEPLYMEHERRCLAFWTPAMIFWKNLNLITRLDSTYEGSWAWRVSLSCHLSIFTARISAIHYVKKFLEWYGKNNYWGWWNILNILFRRSRWLKDQIAPQISKTFGRMNLVCAALQVQVIFHNSTCSTVLRYIATQPHPQWVATSHRYPPTSHLLACLPIDRVQQSRMSLHMVYTGCYLNSRPLNVDNGPSLFLENFSAAFIGLWSLKILACNKLAIIYLA